MPRENPCITLQIYVMIKCTSLRSLLSDVIHITTASQTGLHLAKKGRPCCGFRCLRAHGVCVCGVCVCMVCVCVWCVCVCVCVHGVCCVCVCMVCVCVVCVCAWCVCYISLQLNHLDIEYTSAMRRSSRWFSQVPVS